MLRTKAAERTSGTPVHAGFFSILMRLGQEGMALAKDCPLSSCISGSIRVEGVTYPQCCQTLWYLVTVHLVACSAANAIAHFYSQLENYPSKLYCRMCAAPTRMGRAAAHAISSPVLAGLRRRSAPQNSCGLGQALRVPESQSFCDCDPEQRLA